MGNNSSGQSSFEEHNWRKIEQGENKTILFNDVTNKSIQRHQAVLNCDEGEAISICKWRQNLPNDCCIVDLYQYGIKPTGMCNGHAQLYVITERMHMLSQIGKISKSEGFLILRDVASGLKILFKKFGMFSPTSTIIGVNSQGRAKVWINSNFAMNQPEFDNISGQNTEKAITNKLIKIIESKTYSDSSLPIDYPRNLDLTSVVNYINKVFQQLEGFQVDRVYIDRAQFAKKYKELRQKQQQKQQMSRAIAYENERRLKQIQALHQALRLQQLQLERRQQYLLAQAVQKQQQQALKIQMLQQQQLQQQQQQQLYMQQQLLIPQTTVTQTNVVSHPTMIQQNLLTPQTHYIGDNSHSRGKIMKGTTSTVNTAEIYPNNNFNKNNTYIPSYSQVTNPFTARGQTPNVSIQKNNTFRQSTAIWNAARPQQQTNTGALLRPQNISARPPLPSPSPSYQNVRPANQLANPQIPKSPFQGSLLSQREGSLQRNNKVRKNIQMVDSMIFLQDDQVSQRNKKYVESRIIKYAA